MNGFCSKAVGLLRQRHDQTFLLVFKKEQLKVRFTISGPIIGAERFQNVLDS